MKVSEACKFNVGDVLYFPSVQEVAEGLRGRIGELVHIDYGTVSYRKYGVDFGAGFDGCTLQANSDGFSLEDPTGAWLTAEDLERAKPVLHYDVASTGTCTLRTASGLKHDGGKPLAAIPYQDFPHAMTAVVDVATFGAAKYARSSWKSVPNAAQRYADAMHRHMLAQARGERLDPESGLPHCAHIAWNALALAELELAAPSVPACTAPTTQHAEKNS